MSRVNLIAADKALPLCDRQEFRTSIVKLPESVIENFKNAPENSGKTDEDFEKFRTGISIGMTRGFLVTGNGYYDRAVAELNYAMKPFQYELLIEHCETDLNHLLTYLRESFSPGEEVELWSLWVGSGHGERPIHYRGRLSEFDLDTLGMLTETQKEPDLTGEYPDGLFSQICITVEI